MTTPFESRDKWMTVTHEINPQNLAEKYSVAIANEADKASLKVSNRRKKFLMPISGHEEGKMALHQLSLSNVSLSEMRPSSSSVSSDHQQCTLLIHQTLFSLLLWYQKIRHDEECHMYLRPCVARVLCPIMPNSSANSERFRLVL